MRESAEEITRHGVKIVTVAPAPGDQLAPFIEEYGPYPFPLYGDPTNALYLALGSRQMSKWDMVKLVTRGIVTGGVKISEIVPKDPKQREISMKAAKTQDVALQGGTCLLSATGDMLWQHRDQTPDDHATISMILEQIKQNDPVL